MKEVYYQNLGQSKLKSELKLRKIAKYENSQMRQHGNCNQLITRINRWVIVVLIRALLQNPSDLDVQTMDHMQQIRPKAVPNKLVNARLLTALGLNNLIISAPDL